MDNADVRWPKSKGTSATWDGFVWRSVPQQSDRLSRRVFWATTTAVIAKTI